MKLYQRFINFNQNISRVRYEIGFINADYNQIINLKNINKVKWLKHNYKDRWFADPFILDVTDKFILLVVEEFFYKNSKGRISKLTIDKFSYRLLRIDVLLELPSHLSFPIIKREKSNIYIYPENSQANRLCLYRLVDNNTKVLPEKEIIKEPLTDAVLFNDYIFTTALPFPNGNELRILKKEQGSDNYFYCSTIHFKENLGRNAGDYFVINNRLFRPAQECNSCYGHCVVIQELSKNIQWETKEICRLYSPHHLLKNGLHTLNSYKKITVIDVNGPRHPRIKQVVTHLYDLYTYIKNLYTHIKNVLY